MEIEVGILKNGKQSILIGRGSDFSEYLSIKSEDLDKYVYFDGYYSYLNDRLFLQTGKDVVSDLTFVKNKRKFPCLRTVRVMYIFTYNCGGHIFNPIYVCKEGLM